MKGSAGFPEHPNDERDEKDGPDPTEQAKDVTAGAEDQYCGTSHSETKGSDARPALGLVRTARGEFRQHRAPDGQGKQGEPRDHRLAAPAKEENVENESEDESDRDGREHDQTYVTAPRPTTFVDGWVVVRSVRHRGHAALAKLGIDVA
jgi:hypothetical protein